MASIFSYDSKVGRIFMRIAEAFYLNLLWLVCSFPIFTMGAATCALYSVTIKMAENREGDIRQQFFRAFRDNFKQATQVWLVLLGIGAFLAADVYVLQRLRAASTGAPAIFWTIVLAIVIAAIIAYVVELLFVFPLIATVENDNISMMKNALLIGTHYLNCTIMVFGLHFLMMVIAVRFFTPILILGEGLVALGSSYLFAPVMRAVTTKPDGTRATADDIESAEAAAEAEAADGEQELGS